MRELIPAVGLVLAGAVVVWQQPGVGAPEDQPVRAAHAQPAAVAQGSVQGSDRGSAQESDGVPGPADAAVPRSISVPALGVDATVEPVSMQGSELDPPTDPSLVGWWAQGARPGDRAGAAVLTGHTVNGGGGVFDDLETLAEGDEVTVRGDAAATSYVVDSVETVSREQLAARSARLLGQRGPHRLVLVTCEDWDGAAYRSSVVVVASPLTR